MYVYKYIILINLHVQVDAENNLNVEEIVKNFKVHGSDNVQY